jgi:hypothetical protein
MSFWKPEVRRAALLRTGITREHAWVYEPDKPMGNWAAGMVDCMVSAALVGLLDQMVDLCPRAIDWIDRAVARDEQSGPSDDNTFYLQSLLQAKAMAIWLDTHVNAQAVWADAFDRLLGLLLREVTQTRSRLKGDLIDDLMACGLQGGRWEQAMAAYDQLVGAKSLTIKAVRNPRQLAYLHCQQALESRWSPADLLVAGRRVLQKNLAEEWLHNGQTTRAAIWLKIVHWTEHSGLTPAQTLLKAYDDMPTIARPGFL